MGLILLDDTICTGQEQSLTECNGVTWNNHNCFHKYDIGVQCTGNALLI